MPSSDTDSFIKITCDWQGTCNRFFPTTKQLDFLRFTFLGTILLHYCWVYLGVRMFCIRVVFVVLSSVLAWMYAVIKRVITNHNMWPIFSTNVSLRVQSYFRLFLLHGHLRVIRAMDIWSRHIEGYIQECTVFCVKALDSLHSRYLAVIFFLEIIFEITHKVHPTPVRKWVSFGGLDYFWSYFCPCYCQYRVKLDREAEITDISFTFCDLSLRLCYVVFWVWQWKSIQL